jgi:hypothetical protein
MTEINRRCNVKEKIFPALKKILKFAALLLTVYGLWRLGMYLFPGTIGGGTQEAGQDVVNFWTTAYQTIKDSFKEVIKQFFLNIHQSIVLVFVGWLFAGVKRLWSGVRERVYILIDVYLGKMAQEKRENIKKYLDTIIIANIELVESAFATISGGSNEDIEEKRRRNEEKLTAALTMTLYDLMKNESGRELVKDYTKEEIVRMLICEIEKNILKQKIVSDSPEANIFASPIMACAAGSRTLGLEDNISEEAAGRLRKLIKKTSDTLPAEYQAAIKESVSESK